MELKRTCPPKKQYSVLMSIYSKEDPLFFEQALNSIAHQTILPSDFVLVCDGPLTNDLDQVIKKYETIFGDVLNVIRYDENKGLGFALNVGLQKCKNEIVIRADSDDISTPERAEKQIEDFVNSGVDISSSTIRLFDDCISSTFGKRELPDTAKKIIKFSKRRSPFNHPSVIFKKTAVLKAGGYKELPFKEDYYLWIRMIQSGAAFNNTKETLVYMRVNKNTFAKRKDKQGYLSLIWLYKYMLKTKYINKRTYALNRVVAFFRRYLPNWITTIITKMTWRE